MVSRFGAAFASLMSGTDDEEQRKKLPFIFGSAINDLGISQQAPQTAAEQLAPSATGHPSGSTNWRTQQQWEAAHNMKSYKGPAGWSNVTPAEYNATAGGAWNKRRSFPQFGLYQGYGQQQLVQR